MSNVNELARLQHPRFARLYERISVDADRRGSSEHRDRLLAGLTGRVIEVGAGNGLNFARYPTTVSDVVAVEPDNVLRSLAERAARAAPVRVRVVAGHADRLPADDSEFDGAVVSLVLCSVPDQASALAEVRRVVRPGGLLRFYEHVRSSGRLAGRVQDLITPVWSRVAGGCHPNRRTAEAIARAGFTIETIDRFVFRPLRFNAPTVHILGTARR